MYILYLLRRAKEVIHESQVVLVVPLDTCQLKVFPCFRLLKVVVDGVVELEEVEARVS